MVAKRAPHTGVSTAISHFERLYVRRYCAQDAAKWCQSTVAADRLVAFGDSCNPFKFKVNVIDPGVKAVACIILPAAFCGLRMTLIPVARRHRLQPPRYPHLSTSFCRGAVL